MDLLADTSLITPLFDGVGWAWDRWREFPWNVPHAWLARVFDYTGRVIYFLPLLLVLWPLKGDTLRRGIVATGVLFLAYNFGVLYPLFWLGLCWVFFRLSEQFAIEIKRTDVLAIGPPLAALACVLGMNLLVGIVQAALILPPAADVWLREHAWFLYPLGARPLSWEPVVPMIADASLFPAVFSSPHVIGTAYFTIRMLHYFSELKRETIPPKQRSLLRFTAYLCYAPAIMQGPIERYSRFNDEIESSHLRRGLRPLPYATYRAGVAILKLLLSAIYFGPLVNEYIYDPGEWLSYARYPETYDSYWVLYLAPFIEIFNLYLRFSGYCDLVVAISHVLGYRHAENFAKPWLSTSMRDFWRRWHITLSFVLRDYVYIPLGGSRQRNALNLIVTFFLCGLWHAPNISFGIWGAVMGLMVWINQRWVQWTKHIDEVGTHWFARLRRGARVLTPLPTVLAWLITMNAFCLSLLWFFHGEEGFLVAWELLRRPLNALGAGVLLESGAIPPLNELLGNELPGASVAADAGG